MEHDGEVVAITAYYHNGNNSAFVLTAIYHMAVFTAAQDDRGVDERV
jgi:hypothetical protein|tara:strand:+ start:10269 stop:10409 length:141 start_codon:yes stop_codon:yes gene_type:complete